ncbi:MAG: hypothetical protein LBN95_07870 [Prevotellaceae bacterium]|jgi:predicted GIY-YIG superfamily endonuclease|nr:hypothetical protein [Prevotellaceae bacterium]
MIAKKTKSKKSVKTKKVDETFNRIINEILKHIKQNSNGTPDFSMWYVGITYNPKQRVVQHKQTYPDLIHFKKFYGYTLNRVHNIEAYFSKEFGTKNTSKLGNPRPDSYYVYVYRIEPTIKESILGHN